MYDVHMALVATVLFAIAFLAFRNIRRQMAEHAERSNPFSAKYAPFR